MRAGRVARVGVSRVGVDRGVGVDPGWNGPAGGARRARERQVGSAQGQPVLHLGRSGPEALEGARRALHQAEAGPLIEAPGARVRLQDAIRRHFEPEDTTGRFEVIFELNPFYLRGDFNGDGAPDLAVLVRERASDKRGIAILHGGAAEPVIIGAGTPFRDGDFRWMGVWKVFPQDLALLDEGRDLPADAAAPEGLFVEKPESASGVIYWNGRRYVWSQVGD